MTRYFKWIKNRKSAYPGIYLGVLNFRSRTHQQLVGFVQERSSLALQSRVLQPRIGTITVMGSAVLHDLLPECFKFCQAKTPRYLAEQVLKSATSRPQKSSLLGSSVTKTGKASHSPSSILPGFKHFQASFSHSASNRIPLTPPKSSRLGGWASRPRQNHGSVPRAAEP